MNIQKLHKSEGSGREFHYLGEVVKRLEKILGPRLAHDEIIALMDIITLYSFQFADGFVLNNDADVTSTIGISSAAAVAACFSQDPHKDWQWWKAEYSAYDRGNEKFQRCYDAILAKIVRYPAMHSTSR